MLTTDLTRQEYAVSGRKAGWRQRAVRWFDPYAPAVMLAPAVVFLFAFTIFPTIYSLGLSLTAGSAGANAGAVRVNGFDNYRQVLGDPRTLNSVGVTLTFILSAVPVQLVCGLAVALLIHKQRRGAGVVRAVIMLPMMITPVVVGLIWRLMFNTDVGLVNFFLHSLALPTPNWLGLASTGLLAVTITDVWEWTPFVTLIVLAALQAMPTDPLEAAKIDGAGPWQRFRFVTWPLLVPSLTVCALLRFVDSVKYFDLFYVLTGGGPGNATEVISLYAYKQGFKFFKIGHAAALSYVILLGIIVVVNLVVATGILKRQR